jgi:hypothetical protein
MAGIAATTSTEWAPDEGTRNRILVTNPEVLYGFPNRFEAKQLRGSGVLAVRSSDLMRICHCEEDLTKQSGGARAVIPLFASVRH